MEVAGKIVEKIHHDINTAYLDRFQTCSEVVDREKVESQKYDIAQLGFKSYEDEIYKSEKIKSSKEYIELINRLKIDYPYKKFITYDQIGKILEKYPLVLSTPNRFIGEIPNNNIKDILSFKLKKEDEGYLPIPNISASLKSNKELSLTRDIVEILIKSFVERERFSHRDLNYIVDKRNEVLNQLKNKYGEIVRQIFIAMGLNIDSYTSKDSFVINNYYFKLRTETYGVFLDKYYSLINSDYTINVQPDLQHSHNPQFWILATPDQFNIRSSEIVVGGCIKEVGEGKIISLLKDDPIIFKPIKEGLIVVTQWGAEAQLSEFTNSSNN